MSDLAEMRERHQRVLAELAELGLAFARDARRDAEAAETPDQRAQQALVFQRVSSSVRQSLALEAKLARDGDLAAREAADRQARQTRERVRVRTSQLRDAVHALAWREFEADEDDGVEGETELYDIVLGLVEAEAERADFLTAELADQVARVINGLGYEFAADGQLRPTPAVHSSA